jgi:hypothetical protein
MSGEIRFSPSFTVQYIGGDMLVDVDSGSDATGLDMTYIDFGYSITDAVNRLVDFNQGFFRMGQSYFTVAASVGVVISNSPAYIYVEYIRGGTPVLMTPTNDLNATIPDQNAYRHLLYTFTISNSAGLQISRIHNLGGIQVGAYWT